MGFPRSAARVSFVGGDEGPWKVERQVTICGAPLAQVSALRMEEGEHFLERQASWVLQGVRSNERYLSRDEKAGLTRLQAGLGRPEARWAALIPITKSKAWWELAQDERRAIMEERSHHIALGSKYLPAVARRLFHGRDLGAEFDFLTWFEFADSSRGAFEELVGALRETEEWSWVEREVELQLRRFPWGTGAGSDSGSP